MKKEFFKCLGVSLLILGITSSSNQTITTTVGNDSTMADAKNKKDTNEVKWVSLFDGKSLAGWHGFNKTGEIKNWKIEDSALVCLGAAKDAHGGDIGSDKEYYN